MARPTPPSTGIIDDREALFQKCLKPGNRVSIVVTRDEIREIVSVRRSRLHDIAEDGRLVLAQTSPPVTRSYVNRPVEISFLIRSAKQDEIPMIRFGYRTRLLGIIQDYDLGNNFRETILIAPPPKYLEEMNLRMHYRAAMPMGVQALIAPAGKNMREAVDENLARLHRIMRNDILESEKPQEDLIHELDAGNDTPYFENISLYKKPQIANLLDLSQGGALLSHTVFMAFSIRGNRLDLTLSWEDYRIELASRVIRHGEIGGKTCER